MPRTKEQFEILRQGSRQKILDAALKVFAEEGYNSATIGALAKTAGISQGLLYNYFKGKDEVLYELMVGKLEPLLVELMPSKPGQKFSRNDMVKLINRSIDLVLEKPAFWKLYTSIFIQPDVMSILIDKVLEMSKPYMKMMINYFKEKGEKDPASTVRIFSAIMDGIQMHCMIDPKTFPAEKAKKFLIKQFT